MAKRSSERDRDENELAADILRTLTGADGAPEDDATKAKKLAAKLLGALGGKKGGPARAKKLTAKRRAEIARKAALKRWQARSHAP